MKSNVKNTKKDTEKAKFLEDLADTINKLANLDVLIKEKDSEKEALLKKHSQQRAEIKAADRA